MSQHCECDGSGRIKSYGEGGRFGTSLVHSQPCPGIESAGGEVVAWQCRFSREPNEFCGSVSSGRAEPQGIHVPHNGWPTCPGDWVPLYSVPLGKLGGGGGTGPTPAEWKETEGKCATCGAGISVQHSGEVVLTSELMHRQPSPGGPSREALMELFEAVMNDVKVAVLLKQPEPHQSAQIMEALARCEAEMKGGGDGQ